VCFDGSKKICLVLLDLCLACFCNLIRFEDWFFRFRSTEVLVSIVMVLCIYFSSRVSCLTMKLRLLFVKLFWWMMCLVFDKVSSPGNL
jgi:hypothetical protein